MSLDQWNSMQVAVRTNMEFNVRQAGEGCEENNNWNKMYQLKRKDGEILFLSYRVGYFYINMSNHTILSVLIHTVFHWSLVKQPLFTY